MSKISFESFEGVCVFSWKLVKFQKGWYRIWPSGVLEISVAGRRVQVRTKGVLVKHPQVRKSLKELSVC